MKKVTALSLLILVFLFHSVVVCGIGEIKLDGVKYTCVGHKLIVAGIDPSIKTLDIKKNLNIGGTEYFVSSIQRGALSGSNVELINLPEEGININAGAFKNAAKLHSIKNLDKASIESSDYLFMECCSLHSVDLPENLAVIGSSMFFGCVALENVKIPKSVKKIDADSFLGCVRLNKVNVEIGSELNSIEKGAFAGCKNLAYINVPKDINIAEYAFFDCDKLDLNCNIPESVRVRDKNLEAKCKQAESFVQQILDNEMKNGRDCGELVDAKDIDRLLYKYTPKSTDTPTVVSKEEFDKLTSDGRLVLYRGDLPCIGKNGQKITIKEINDAFKYGDYYYPAECNGIFCTKYVDHAKSYALNDVSKTLIGSVTQFCFTDILPDNLKVITRSELQRIEDFYKYSHIENYLKFMHDWCYIGKYRLENGLLNLGVDTMNFSFLARALGYDLIDDECDEMGGDGCSKETPTSQFEVLNRGKLTVCSENIF